MRLSLPSGGKRGELPRRGPILDQGRIHLLGGGVGIQER